MSDINELLLQMLQARYGKDVRQSIHDSIEMCYDEATGKIQKELIESITTNANRAESAASDAETSAETATEKAAEAAGYATGETESALYYYNQVKNISQSLSGALKPVGTVTFEALPELSEVEAGDMYNISNQFTTTESFKEGAGKVVPAGSNVYKTSDSMWDVLAGSPVAGVKGEEEAEYRQGLINITADNIGALKKNGNAKDVTVTFTSGDSVTAPDNTLPELLVTNETLSSLLSKVSTGIKNIRWLIKTIGTKDISGIGDGSITGAISTLDSNSKKAESKLVKFTLSNLDALNTAVQGLIGVKKVTAFMECSSKKMWNIGIWCVENAKCICLSKLSSTDVTITTTYGFELYYDANNYEIIKVKKDTSGTISFAYQAKIGFASDTTNVNCALLIEY